MTFATRISVSMLSVSMLSPSTLITGVQRPGSFFSYRGIRVMPWATFACSVCRVGKDIPVAVGCSVSRCMISPFPSSRWPCLKRSRFATVIALVVRPAVGANIRRRGMLRCYWPLLLIRYGQIFLCIEHQQLHGTHQPGTYLPVSPLCSLLGMDAEALAPLSA